MALVKTEPQSGNGNLSIKQVESVKTNSKVDENSILANSVSRPPLKQKPINAAEADSGAKVKKELLSRFLIEPNSPSKVKKEPATSTELLSSVVPKKKKIEKPAHENNFRKKEKSTFDNKLLLNEHVNFEPTKLIVTQDVPKKPGAYEIIRGKINEKGDNEDNEYYNEVFSMAEWKDECIDLAKCSMNEWICVGQELLLEQQRLMSKMVHARIQLSHRFQVITELINERAGSLLNQGDLLEEKLRKVQTLGKEILELL